MIPEEFSINKSKLDKDLNTVFFRLDPVYNNSKRARLACNAPENAMSQGIVATAMKSKHRKLKCRSVFNQIMYQFLNPSIVTNTATITASSSTTNVIAEDSTAEEHPCIQPSVTININNSDK